MRNLLAALILTTLSLAAAQRKNDPTVCDNAKLRYGIGFNPHPTDCNQYVLCYYVNGVVPVYKSCKFGEFWDHNKLRCEPSDLVQCATDKCKAPGKKFYKHSDLNNCVAHWKCSQGISYGECCPVGKGFHPELGCVENPKCTDMCPFDDRVPACNRRPVSGSPTRYMQYTDHGEWKKERCPAGRAFSPVGCECSIEGVIVPGKVCNPDVVIDFNNGRIQDVSGNGYELTQEKVQVFNNAGYFNGTSRLVVPPLRPLANDEGVLIIKMRYREKKGRKYMRLQTMVTNGCGTVQPSVLIAKSPFDVLLGAETFYEVAQKDFPPTYLPLPSVDKAWKEIIYIHDEISLEGKVCGASKDKPSLGTLKPTGCGFQFGAGETDGFVGLLDDISIYRCKPLDTVLTVNY